MIICLLGNPPSKASYYGRRTKHLHTLLNLVLWGI